MGSLNLRHGHSNLGDEAWSLRCSRGHVSSVLILFNLLFEAAWDSGGMGVEAAVGLALALASDQAPVGSRDPRRQT